MLKTGKGHGREAGRQTRWRDRAVLELEFPPFSSKPQPFIE